LGTKSTVATASVGAIGIPLTPPPESGLSPSACHCRCWSSGIVAGRGKDAQATPLHSKASAPALFQPGVGQPRSSDRRSGCAWVRDVNTRPLMPIQG
jgi:hypothetical protein